MANAFFIVLSEQERELPTKQNNGLQRDLYRQLSYRTSHQSGANEARKKHYLAGTADWLHPREPLQNHAPQMDLHGCSLQDMRRFGLRLLQGLLRLAQLLFLSKICEQNRQSIATIFPMDCNG